MPTRRFSLLAVALLVLLVKPASAGRGKGHCGHQGTGTGHQGDDCGESTPTPTPTPVPTSTATPVATPTPTPGCNCPTPRTLVWKDATGLTIEGAYSWHPMASTLFYADANGYFWTLELSNLVVYQSFAEDAIFESFDCTGPGYMRLDSGYRNPHVVFRMNYDPTPANPTFYVFPDDIAQVTINAHSIQTSGGACGSWNVPNMKGYPLSERIVVTRPVLTGIVPPLHAEFE